jgi:23S rRNA (cytosine1962-C5)-methyltransferase
MSPVAVVSRRGAARLRSRHPWIFRSDVVEADAEPGDVVAIRAERGRPLGWAYWSSTSQIALRVLSFDAADLGEDQRWLTERIRSAARYRTTLGIDDAAWRLVHGESDGLPATIVDRYADAAGDLYFVIQTLAQGSDRRLGALVGALVTLFAPRGVIARNDPRVRALEGLPEMVEVVHGEVPDRIDVVQGGVRYGVDLRHGQKTGLFLDQRENHRAAAGYAKGRTLDAFTYNGGFALQMARHAAEVLAIDASEAAVAQTRDNAQHNGLTNVEVRAANVFDELRELEIAGERFDTIVLDPPAFAKNKASVERALGGYKEINLRAMHLLAPAGHLITCSCSYNVDEPLFLGVLQAAAADAGLSMVVVERRMQARDHPVLVTVPESAYLKCVVLRRQE